MRPNSPPASAVAAGATAPPPADRSSPPSLRGRLHQAAFLACLPATAILLAAARTSGQRLAALVYAASALGLFGVSGVYHRAYLPRAQRALKRVDHSMIFVFEAGSYTPFGVILLNGSTRVGFLAALWLFAAGGVVLENREVDRVGGPADLWRVALAGSGLPLLPHVLPAMSALDVALYLGGLGVYFAGAVVLSRRRPDPLPTRFGYHELSHAIMLGGTVCHYLLYLHLLRVR
ncbi:MAG: hemolysin III family protein [Mycobacteriales bacterium]